MKFSEFLDQVHRIEKAAREKAQRIYGDRFYKLELGVEFWEDNIPGRHDFQFRVVVGVQNGETLYSDDLTISHPELIEVGVFEKE